MKHLFLSHCEINQAYRDATEEERKKFFDEMKKSAEKAGLEVVFIGNPWGIIESITLVLKSDKSLDHFIEWRRTSQLTEYFSASRTITVTELPFLA